MSSLCYDTLNMFSCWEMQKKILKVKEPSNICETKHTWEGVEIVVGV